MSDFFKVNVTNSKTDAIAFEKKFPKDISVVELKNKLEIVTGGCAGTMTVELYNGDKLLSKLLDNNALLGSYSIEDGMRIHVVDNFALFENENVEKFELTEDQYKQKQDTLRNFLKQNRLGKYDEEEMKKIEEKKKEAAKEDQKLAEACIIGSRCQVRVKGQPHRIGEIMYNGPLEDKRGTFIGVKFDEPLGVNDGSVNGNRYFDCAPKYGSFVAPSAVVVGDFPPENFDLDDEI